MYKILLVEDELQDAELNIREIRKVLSNSKFEMTEDKPEYLNLLETFIPDIIISDFNMPTFDGLSALRIAQEVCPLTPFIMVTGSINEDTAVECMKAGATDYVLKDNLKRLGAAVMSALEQKKIKLERAQAIESIKISEAKYRFMFDNNPQPMWIFDIETLDFLEVNEAAVKHYGYSSEEFLSMKLSDIWAISPVAKDNTETAQKLPVLSQSAERIHKKKNGDQIHVEIISHAIIFNERNARHVLIKDITQRKVAEEKLLNERKLLRTLIDNLPVTIYIKDEECRKTIANRADLDIIGVESEDEIVGKTDLEVYNNETGARGYLDDKSVIETGIPVLNREEDFTDQNGNLRWLLTSKIPLTDEHGKIVGLVGIGRDITEQKIAQAQILKLSKGIDQSPISIEITDTNGVIEYVNPKYCEITGYDSNEVIGQDISILKTGLMSNVTFSELWDTIEKGKVWSGEIQNRKKDGSLYWESATITGIKNEKGIITNYIALLEDVTERKKMQVELVEAKEKAEESDRLKSAFLANMSHEIRTPLNSIIGFSELLGDPDFDQEQKDEFIKTIVENGNSLLLIISDIMDFSMLEAGQLRTKPESISASELIEEVFNDFAGRARIKNLEFKISETSDNVEIIFESDRYRIRQIFSNLISNSIKFTEKGGIEIGYQRQGDFILFNVKDTGIGIAKEHFQSIFERFRQVDTAKTRKYGGNGLGLAISKNLAELLGGKIWLESQICEYSNFFFTIPIEWQREN